MICMNYVFTEVGPGQSIFAMWHFSGTVTDRMRDAARAAGRVYPNARIIVSATLLRLSGPASSVAGSPYPSDTSTQPAYYTGVVEYGPTQLSNSEAREAFTREELAEAGGIVFATKEVYRNVDYQGDEIQPLADEEEGITEGEDEFRQRLKEIDGE